MQFRWTEILTEPFRRIPTADLYLLNPLRALGRRQARQVRPLGRNAYLVGRTGIVVRTGSARDLDALATAGARRFVYVADDDFAAGAADPALPEHYRERLAAFVAADWPALRDAADQVVVSSPDLAAAYGAKARLLHPVWHAGPAHPRHFDGAGRIEIAHLGTASHGADFAPLVPVLRDILARHPEVRLTLFGAAGPPAGLEGPQIRVIRPMRWWRYRLWLPRQRFHLALYSLAPTRWNAARSANKLFEQAVTGAAPLLTRNPALSEVAGEGLAAIFVEGGPEEWGRRIEADLADREEARARAESVRARLAEFDAAGRGARLWSELLDLG